MRTALELRLIEELVRRCFVWKVFVLTSVVRDVRCEIRGKRSFPIDKRAALCEIGIFDFGDCLVPLAQALLSRHLVLGLRADINCPLCV
jgi:hypothetical protein